MADPLLPDGLPGDPLRKARAAIDALDLRLVELLQQRALLAQQVGRLKQADAAPVYRPEREAEVLRRVGAAAAAGPLDASALQGVFRQVISACRALERVPAVAYLGPPGTFSELALLRQFGAAVRAQPCGSIDEVFRAAETGQVEFAIVPSENSTEGAVSRTLDLLLATPLRIIAEISIPVRHQLLTVSGRLEGIERVLAHPQALAQCVAWLNQHLPGVERQPVSSNAEAARLAAADPRVAAIAGEHAGVQYALLAAAEQIQDDPLNRTRFLVLGRHGPAASGRDKTSLILSVPNRAGAVYRLLAPLAEHGVSMTRFESRPARSGAWEYHFFVDIEGHADDAPVAAVLAALRTLCSYFKFLGSYPAEEAA